MPHRYEKLKTVAQTPGTPQMLIEENVQLAALTTLKVGGPARFFARAESEDDVRHALELAAQKHLPVFVLGGGSNVVISDAGWPGLVLKIALKGMAETADDEHILFSVAAGENWDDFARHAVQENCGGIECLSGIPGSVGATPVQNVGAYGQEVSQTIDSVRVLDTRDRSILEMSSADCDFGYRTSRFNKGDPAERGRFIILQVTFRLKRGGAPELKYTDLQRYFDVEKQPPSLFAVREAVLELRKRKGMLIVEGDPSSRSVGSFFKNPVLTAKKFEETERIAQSYGLKIPSYPALDAQHKVSAAWLVENSGFTKGFRLGRAGISWRHALAIVNADGATANDILQLKNAIQQAVLEKWGIPLEPEPVFVGV